MRKLILLLFIFSLPLAAQFKPLDFKGFWRGTWENITLHTDDSAFVTVNIKESDSSIVMIMDLKGNVFGGKSPDPAEMTGSYDQNGFTASGYSPYYGYMYFSGTSSGIITGRLPDVPSPSIDSVNFLGNFSSDTLGMNFTASYGGVVLANGIISLDKDTSVIVPVELTSFSALVINNKDIELKWKTSTEINNSGFEIERKAISSDGNSIWTRIAFIKGNGTTTEKKYYSYTDLKLQPGKYLYRLKQIDYDGSYNYSDSVTASLSIPAAFELRQNYPNPFNPVTSISFSVPYTSRVTISIYNILGQLMIKLIDEMKEPGFYELNWNAEDFNSGIYIYSMQAQGNNGKESFKSIKKMTLLK